MGSQPVPQTHQAKAPRQDPYLLEEEEEQYSYKPVKGQQNKTTVLYSDVIGNSRQEYGNDHRGTATNKRPWSGARPASRTSRSSTRGGSRSSFNGPERNQYKQVNYNPRVPSGDRVETHQYKPQRPSAERLSHG